MAKPILIIKCGNMKVHDGVFQALYKGEDSKGKELNEDYFVFTTMGTDKHEIEIEVLNAINATDIELEELKERVLTQLNEKKNVEQS